METEYFNSWQIETTVRSSQCDSMSMLRPKAILEIMQDAAEEHSKHMGVDGPTITAKDGVFWVLSRTKFVVHRKMRQGEPLIVKTWPMLPNEIRCHRCFTFKDAQGNITVEGLGEWVLIDAGTRTLRKFSTVGYPMEMPHLTDLATNGKFIRLRNDFTPEEFIETRKIRSSYIDWPHHNNNTNYATLVLDTFSVKELESMNIQSMEITFLHETVENENISIYRRKTDTGYIFCIRRESGECATMISISNHA
ncbi:MAG: thioesterase [Bacteroidaceae bacterium]|nr:thioesterase [Bacteroidaceae bacterium]